jgi:hypothetical protein
MAGSAVTATLCATPPGDATAMAAFVDTLTAGWRVRSWAITALAAPVPSTPQIGQETEPGICPATGSTSNA